MSRPRTAAGAPAERPEERIATAAYRELADRSGGPSSRRKRVVEAVSDELRAVTRIREGITLRIAKRAVARAEEQGITTASGKAEEIARVAMSCARAGTLDG